jgi:hypothetical protein
MPNRTDNDSLTRLSTAELRWRVLSGDGYSTGEYFDSVGGGDEKQLYLANPTEDTHYAIANVVIRGEAKVTHYKAFNVTEDTQGNAPDTGVQNKISSDGSSQAIARIGGDGETGAYSNGRELSTKTAGESGNPNQLSPGDVADNGVTNAIAPGDDMCLFVTNDTTSTRSMSIDVDWVEIPESDYP